MIRALIGDCRDLLPTLPDASVHCVVTSPPYWGLRDYGIDAQLGLEPDFNAYVASMVAVFREVRRVLRDDGTLWLNLGDSYASDPPGQCADPHATSTLAGIKTQVVGREQKQSRPLSSFGLPRKNLCGIPWRVAFALQADGWYLRQDIIWSKPNPMPESVTDRCTKAHEYLFLLSKRERYYYDADAIREPIVSDGRGGLWGANRGPLATWAHDETHRGAHGTPLWRGERTVNEIGRNKRSVWEVTTQPFSEAHFATFPPALIEPCIKAGTSEKGCCGKCGRPWVRQIEKTKYDPPFSEDRFVDVSRGDKTRKLNGADYNNQVRIIGETWSACCACAADPVPCTVLDPFAGAGTTGLVADRLQRNAILIELNPAYAVMGERRIVGDAPLFVEMSHLG